MYFKLQENQQDQEDQEEPLFEMFMAESHLLRPVIAARYTGHPRDVKREIRPTIIRSLDVPLTEVYKMIVDKRLDEALFYFYNAIFPTAIHTIIEVETTYLGLKITDEYTNLLVKYFYLAMNEKTEVAREYIRTHLDKDYNYPKWHVFTSDSLYIDIVRSRMTLYSGRVETTDPEDVKENRLTGSLLKWVFVGTNYREQIIRHVSLFWELFMVYHGIESKSRLFTIPEKVYYWPGDTLEVTPEAFSAWAKIPPEEKMVFTGMNLYLAVKDIYELEGVFG